MQSLQQTQASLAQPSHARSSQPESLHLSRRACARNEEATIAAVVERSFAAFAALGRTGEVLVVNDGSTDRTAAILRELQIRFPTLRVFTHRRSRGMTAALQRMFTASQGDIVILIPADMESDPLRDVPTLVNTLESTDLDVAAGWRQGRRDNKVLASKVYNVVMDRIAGVHVHDGNWIKAMRREVVASFPPLRSDWHRFLLMIAVHNGFRVGEVPTFLPAAPGGEQQVWLGAHPQELARCVGAQVFARL